MKDYFADDEYWKENINKKLEEDLWIDEYKEYIANNGLCLDLGCGIGQYSKKFIEYGYDVVSADISNIALERVKEFNPNIVNVDMREILPFEDNKFDIVFANLSIHYFSDADTKKLMNEIKRILKNNGLFIGSVNGIQGLNAIKDTAKELEHHFYYNKDRHVRLFDVTDVKKYLEPFGIIRIDERETIRFNRKKNYIVFIAKKHEMNSIDKRNSVREDYNLIADQYFKEYGTELDDIELINKFESLINKNSMILDLGGGTGKLSDYFIKKGFKSVCYDFSENLKNYAEKTFPNVPFILDDILNVKNHYRDNSIEAIISMYSLFHIPKENINQLFIDINSLLKDNGLFCFSLQLGSGEKFVNEPYLKENGKNVLYMNYLTKNEIYELLNNSNFDIIYETEKHETGDNVIGEDRNHTIYIIARKRS